MPAGEMSRLVRDTPMTSFGVFASSSVPVWMTMRRPLATNALNSRSSHDDDLGVARG